MIEEDFWRPVLSVPGYEVSTFGRLRRGKELVTVGKPTNGHRVANVKVKGEYTTRRLSRLVGEAFCRTFRVALRVHYKDGDPANCRPDNLDWVTGQIAAPKKKREKKKAEPVVERRTLTEAQALKILMKMAVQSNSKPPPYAKK